MRTLLIVAISALGVGLPGSAWAACEWEWVCDTGGNCAHVPICERTIDLVPVEPPSISPIVPPSVEPIQPPTLPPVGTQDCSQVRRQDARGNWVWDTVCY